MAASWSSLPVKKGLRGKERVWASGGTGSGLCGGVPVESAEASEGGYSGSHSGEVKPSAPSL